MTTLTLGIDLATASARCVVLDTDTGSVVARADSDLAQPERGPGAVSRQNPTYARVALGLVRQVCQQLGPDACRVAAVSVTGTSGTVVPVDWNGAAVGAARLYDDTSSADVLGAVGVAGVSSWADVGSPPGVSGSSVGLDGRRRQRRPGRSSHACRHLALAQGRDRPRRSALAGRRDGGARFDRADTGQLPELVLPGTRVGTVDPEVALDLGVAENLAIVAGMTDGCTAQLAAGAVYDGDTMGVLGTTLVLKAVSQTPIESADGAVYSHLAPDGRYWAGGASNAGAGVLEAEFPGEDLAALDQRVADTVAGYVRYPLVAGERFPVADHHLPAD